MSDQEQRNLSFNDSSNDKVHRIILLLILGLVVQFLGQFN